MSTQRNEPNTVQSLVTRTCPEYDCAKQICKAAIGQMIPSRKQLMRYCGSDSYDHCPIFLSSFFRSCHTMPSLQPDTTLMNSQERRTEQQRR